VTDALHAAFRRQRFTVHTANSALEGFQILSTATIDAVVSDEQMPVMSGSQFLSVVRRQYPDVIRIILSARADMSAVLAAVNDAQAHRFLLKPSTPKEIATCVTDAIDERDRKRSSGAFDKRMHDKAHIRDSFDVAMGSIWIALQPIVRAADSTVFGYEALVRSDHVQFKTAEGLFVVAGQCGRVRELERTIRRSVAQRIGDLPVDVSLMVNVHPRSLCDIELYSSNSPLFPYRSRVILEITESENVHDITGAREGLEKLRLLGYRVAVDDLGAGYSGLNAFALIRPDIVKFDMDLIRNIHTSTTKSNLVRTITRLCRDVGILTVAEGIETKDERVAVVDLGCDLLQGYYISQPTRWSPASD
jgi:EAL domain-containing protein (putative c-di-GMP-specific phosphodiesterase class I)/CheY-like chemotaxis protein